MSKRVVPDMSFVGDSSSDDDAPEEISVAASRQLGIDQIKGIQVLLKKERDEEKERRRQRNEMFRIQKENKLKDLSKRKLPEDVLAAVSVKAMKISQAEDVTNSAPLNEPAGGSDDDEEDSDKDDNDLSDSGVEDVADDYNPAEDFIPIGKTKGLMLATPAALARKTDRAAQQAVSFKYDRLYNQSTIPRETYKQRLAKQAKRKAKMQT